MVRVLIFILMLIGIIFLQIFLSKKENKWYGLFLPILSLIYPILAVLSISTYNTFITTTTLQDGSKIVKSVSDATNSFGSIFFQIIFVFLYTSIPTAILLVIYFACRQGIKKNRELDKMKIGDL